MDQFNIEVSDDDKIEKILIDLEDKEKEINEQVKESEELLKLVQTALKKKLEESNNKEKFAGNIIFSEKFADLLGAVARQTALVIDGRVRAASLSKTRYSILSNKTKGKSDSFSIADLLNE